MKDDEKISNLKPDADILAPVPNERVARRLVLNWGVFPVISPEYSSTDEFLIVSISSYFKDSLQNKLSSSLLLRSVSYHSI